MIIVGTDYTVHNEHRENPISSHLILNDISTTDLHFPPPPPSTHPYKHGSRPPRNPSPRRRRHPHRATPPPRARTNHTPHLTAPNVQHALHTPQLHRHRTDTLADPALRAQARAPQGGDGAAAAGRGGAEAAGAGGRGAAAREPAQDRGGAQGREGEG